MSSILGVYLNYQGSQSWLAIAMITIIIIHHLGVYRFNLHSIANESVVFPLRNSWEMNLFTGVHKIKTLEILVHQQCTSSVALTQFPNLCILFASSMFCCCELYNIIIMTGLATQINFKIIISIVINIILLQVFVDLGKHTVTR